MFGVFFLFLAIFQRTNLLFNGFTFLLFSLPSIFPSKCFSNSVIHKKQHRRGSFFTFVSKFYIFYREDHNSSRALSLSLFCGFFQCSIDLLVHIPYFREQCSILSFLLCWIPQSPLHFLLCPTIFYCYHITNALQERQTLTCRQFLLQ